MQGGRLTTLRKGFPMPGTRSLRLLLVLAVSTSGSQLHAQSVGDRVRVSASGTTYVGQVTVVSDERLELSEGTRTWSIAFSGISRLQRSNGTRSRWRDGLFYGAAVGAGGGVVLGLLTSTTCELVTVGAATEECTKVSLQVTLVTGASLAAVGGLAGMGIGALFRTERWTTIPFGDTEIEYAPTIRPRVGPGGGLGLSFSVRMWF